MYNLKSFATVANESTIKESTKIKKLVEPYNFVSNNLYQGRNKGLLMAVQEDKKFKEGAWATFRQWSDKGYKIIKGQKAVTVFCGWHERTKDDDGNLIEPVKTPKFASVFNIAQVENIKDKIKEDYLTQ